MPSYLPIEQTIFFGNAAADVVDDEVSFVAVVPVVRDESDMCHSFAVEVPGHDIAGLVVAAIGGHRDRFAATIKEGLQVWNASMVDVCVGTFQSPFLRIGRKIRRHIFMDFFLQVDASVAKRSDNNIRAGSGIGRHIAAGVCKYAVILSIVRRYFDLFASAFDNAADRFGGDRVRSRPFKSLRWTSRAKRVLKRRAPAAACKAGTQNDQYKSWSHLRSVDPRNN